MDIKLKFICGEPEGLKSEYFVLLSCIWRAFIWWVLGAATTRLSNSEFKILWLNFYLEEESLRGERKIRGWDYFFLLFACNCKNCFNLIGCQGSLPYLLHYYSNI